MSMLSVEFFSKRQRLYEKYHLKWFAIDEESLTSFKVIGIGVSRLATYDFLLVFHCNYVSIYVSMSPFSIICQNFRWSRDLNTLHTVL